ncbi:MAG: peptide ABC transporter substrate-binding protein [Steroidobacteraceae bacterium]
MNARLKSLLARALLVAALAGIALLLVWLMRPPAEPSQTSTLRRGNGSEAESLDPQAARSEAALTIARDLFEGLMRVGPTGEALPAAAASVEVSADGLRYVFHLRPGLAWSNGDALEAADFLAAWRRLVDPATAAPYAQMLAPVHNAAAITAGKARPESLGVQAPHAGTLMVDLERPAAHFLALMTHPASFPLHRASLARYGSRFAKPGLLVSNGAYALSRWDFGSKILAVRNHHYWDDAHTRIERIEYHVIPQPAAELAAYRADALDITATVPTEQLPWIRAHLAGELHVAPQLAVYYYALNLSGGPFKGSKALRIALSMVIDREQLVRAITALGEMPAYSFVPPGTHGYSPARPAYADWPMARRIERARELLREGGGAPGPIELRYNTGDLHARLAVAVASMWKQALGIDTVLRAEEFKVLLQDIQHRKGLQAFRASWVADYDDPYSFLQLLRGGFGINLPGYASAAYDSRLDEANRATDPTVRASLLQRAEGQMLEDQPLIPLYFYVSKRLVKPRVQGFSDDPLNIVYSKDLVLR